MLLNIFVKKKILKNKNIYWVVAIKITVSIGQREHWKNCKKCINFVAKFLTNGTLKLVATRHSETFGCAYLTTKYI